MAVIMNQDDRSVAIAPAGTTQATATNIGIKHALTASSFTSGAGVTITEGNAQRLIEGSLFNGSSVASAGAATLAFYPWSGAKFNGQTTDTAIYIAPGMGVKWIYLNSTTLGLIY